MASFAHPLLLQLAALAAAQEARKRNRQPKQRLVTGLNTNPLMADGQASRRKFRAVPPASMGALYVQTPDGLQPNPHPNLIPHVPAEPQPLTIDSVQEALDALALATTLKPGVGDFIGGVADAVALARNPNRTDAIAALMGAIPFLPSAGTVKRTVGDLVELRDQTERARDAAEMGFGDVTNRAEDWYHGTAGNIEAFEPKRIGQTSGFHGGEFLLRETRLAHDSPAAYLAREANTPGQPTTEGYAHVAQKKKLDRIVSADEEGLIPYDDQVIKSFEDAGPNIMPLRFRSDRLAEVDFKGFGTSPEHWYQRLSHEVVKFRQKSGGVDPDTMVIRNVRVEDLNAPRSLQSPPREGDRFIDVAVVWDPARLRSIFASFDPKNVGSSEILAGLAAAGLLIPQSVPREIGGKSPASHEIDG